MTETIYDLPLDQITRIPELQPRVGGLDEAHVRMLQEAPDSWAPITVVHRGITYDLVDGFHRVAAAANLGLSTIRARIVPPPADGDLRGLAFALNAGHGRPLSIPDRRAEVERRLTLWPEVSNMEVSRRVDLSPSTVAAIRARLEATASIPPTAERVGADGNRYPVVTSKAVRSRGELPAQSLGEVLGGALGRVFTPAERRQQRQVVQYLQRLVIALEDQHELDGWETADQVAIACRVMLGETQAAELAERLGRTSTNVLEIAFALGYEDSDTDVADTAA